MAIKINGDNSASAVGLSGGDDDSGIKPGTDRVEIVTGGTARVTVTNSSAQFTGGISTATDVNATGNITASGSAITCGANPNGAANVGIRMRDTGQLQLTSNGGTLFQGMNQGTATPTAQIDADGSATFTGRITAKRGTDTDAGLAIQNSQGVNQHLFFGNGQASFGAGQTAIGASGELNTNQNIVLNNGGKGIKFPASNTGNADANTLDDYEEGTWTPVPRFGGTSHILTGTFSGNYTKIGNTVELRFRLTFSAKGTSTGVFTVEGVPFAAVDSFLWCNSGFGFLHRTNLPQTAGQVTADVTGSQINFRLLGQNGGNTTQMDDADLVNTSDFRGSITYRVAT